MKEISEMRSHGRFILLHREQQDQSEQRDRGLYYTIQYYKDLLLTQKSSSVQDTLQGNCPLLW